MTAAIAVTGFGAVAASTSAINRSFVRSALTSRTPIEATATQTRVIPLTLVDGEITIDLTGEEPSWFYALLGSLRDFSFRAVGWDSYDGLPLQFDAAYAALQLISALLPADGVSPALVPTSDGGVQLEWHRHCGDLEITISPEGAVSAYFHDVQADAEWEEEIEADYSRLQDAVAKVTRPD